MARLDGVDISGYDEGIDCAALTADFVIVKATEGLQGTVYNPSYRAMADAAASSGKLIGFYHYANGCEATAEADSFCDAVEDYAGRALMCLDWEGQGNPLFLTGADAIWCKRFLDRVRVRLGATPVLYTSKGVTNALDWSQCATTYPLWGAEYAYDDYTYDGYPDEPWQSDVGWGAWGHDELMHQYGYVNPQPSNGGITSLDGEVFNGSADMWANLCGGGAVVPAIHPVLVEVGLTRANAAAEVMDHLIDHDEGHGYSQPNRAGDGTFEDITLSDGEIVTIRGGDKDCSEAIRTCYAAVGVLEFDYWESYIWTVNERAVLAAHGFVEVDKWTPQRGDVLWVTGHTEMYLGDGMCGGARGDEYGGIDGPTQGDQTGNEIMRREYYAGNWESCWRYTGPERTVTITTTGGIMECIIRPNGSDTLCYLDGHALHPMSHPDHAEAVRMAYRRAYGKEIPEFDLGTKDAPWATRLAEVLASTMPTAQGPAQCIVQLDGATELAYFDGARLHPMANPQEAEALRSLWEQTHGTPIREIAVGNAKNKLGARLLDLTRRMR